MSVMLPVILLILFHYVAVDQVLGEEYSKISPNGMNRLQWNCNKYNNCNIYAIDAYGRRVWVHKESNLPEPYVEWFNDELAQIRISCGSPCFNTIFYDLRNGVSKPFEFVIAANPRNKIVATANSSGIFLYHIFQPSHQPFMRIKRNFSETAALILDIEEARFTESGSLYLRYLSGKKRITKEETIPIKTDTKYMQKYNGGTSGPRPSTN
jgi:hypothetical protein